MVSLVLWMPAVRPLLRHPQASVIAGAHEVPYAVFRHPWLSASGEGVLRLRTRQRRRHGALFLSADRCPSVTHPVNDPEVIDSRGLPIALTSGGWVDSRAIRGCDPCESSMSLVDKVAPDANDGTRSADVSSAGREGVCTLGLAILHWVSS